MTFEEEMLAVDERTDLSEDAARELSIQIILKWLPRLKGEERIIANNSLASLYLDKGKDIKERMMNAREAQPYFEEVWRSGDISPSRRDAAAYHLGHVSLLEGNRSAAYEWFVRALSSESIDRDRRIKSYYQAAKCAVQSGEVDKARKYLRSGRDLDTRRKFQPEYEAAFHLVHRSPDEELFPFILFDGGEKPVGLSYSGYYRLLREPENVILDRGSDHRGAMLYLQKFSFPITDRFATLIKQLAFTNIPPSDEEWCHYVYQDLRASSLRGTIDRIRNDLKFVGFPDLFTRKHNKFYWVGPPLLVVDKV